MKLFTALLMLAGGFVVAETVNQAAPELEIKMENGQMLKLSQYKGKPVLLVFFSTVCPHCQKAAEPVEKTMRAYSAKGLQVIAVTSDENQRKDFPDFRKKYGATYAMGSIGSQESYRFFNLSVMKPFYVPTYAFIDRGGVIRERFIGGLMPEGSTPAPGAELAELAKHVDALFKPVAAKPANVTTHPVPATSPAKARR